MNKKLLLIGAVIVGLLIGGIFLLNNKSEDETPITAIEEESIPTISAEEIGLTLKPGKDSQRVIMGVTKTQGIELLDYELSYTAKGDLPRGALGRVEVTSGKSVSKELYLGTCSDVCHPDTGVKDIKIVVKVTKTDGKVYQAEATTEL